MTETDFVKIHFELEPDEDGYPPDKWETLWAAPEGPGEFRIDNIPFYVRGIASGDVVSAEPDADGVLRFKDLLRPSGNSVFRLYILDESQVAGFRNKLRELGCESELSNVPKLIAVEWPANKPIQPFLKLIVEQAEKGQLEYEEAALRHAV